MGYKHILVAVDLAENNQPVIDKAVSLAKNLNAKLSFIYVDVSYLDVLAYEKKIPNQVNQEHQKFQTELEALCEPINYPISNKLVLGGRVEKQLLNTVKEMNIDLLISGHHHDLWNSWWSSAHKLLALTVVDLLLIRL